MKTRQIVFAPSFDADLAEIATYIELKFGDLHKDRFLDRLAQACETIALFPGMALARHDYNTSLCGVIFELNWIFFDYTDSEIRFFHIVDGRRGKQNVRF